MADTPNAVAWARRHTVDVLRYWQVPADIVDTAQLLVSELTTNAIHRPEPGQEVAPYSALTPVATITVTLRLDGSRLLVLVHDHQPDVPVLKEVGLDAENGRGVFLVAHMSVRWGYFFPPTVRGKVVWAELSLTGNAPDPPASAPTDGQGPSRLERPVTRVPAAPEAVASAPQLRAPQAR